MPIIALMRHGDALNPPHGLKTKSCLKLLNLAEVVAGSLRGIPRVHSSKEYEVLETAKVVANALSAISLTHRALSEDGDNEEIAAFVRSIMDAGEDASAIVVTHRVIIGRLIQEFARQAGKKFIFTDKGSCGRKLALRPKLLEFRPHAIIINTSTMEARIVSTKEHAP